MPGSESVNLEFSVVLIFPLLTRGSGNGEGGYARKCMDMCRDDWNDRRASVRFI